VSLNRPREVAQAKKITAFAALDDAIGAYTKGFEINLLIQKGDPEAAK
jgi:hypothetical protein